MGVCLNWSQPSINSPPSIRRSFTLTDVSIICRYIHPSSSVFGPKLNRSHSCETLICTKTRSQKRFIKRIVSATFDSQYPDDELHDLHDFTVRFQLSDHDDVTNKYDDVTGKYDDVTGKDGDVTGKDGDVTRQHVPDQFVARYVTNWYGDMIPASIERKAKSVGLPFSLRIIQKKKQWEEGFKEVGEYAYCSMKKAFSSMVFIIRELQSYTLQMREVLFVEDLQEILMRVQKEMNASFVWLFQQVFSHTPNLMVCVMILLANYSVYSMSNQVGVAVLPDLVTVESVSTVDDQIDVKFDSSMVKTYSVSPGGINGGGGKFRPVSSGTDGDGKFDQQNEHKTIIPDGASSSTINPANTGEESVSGDVSEVEELGLWNSIVAEAAKRWEGTGVDGLDRETMRRFVSPVTVKMEEEVDTGLYFKTELLYQMGLLEEPDNPLLLANYAQFLYIFYHDHQRAEENFKKATKIEPKDAEALHKYANFLWHAKNDLWAAEENFLEAISADPNNPVYGANYAHFLWSNGANDTCFPLGSRENANSDEA